MRIVWFEGPVNRCHSLLRKESKEGKKIISVSSIGDFDSNVVFKDIFDCKKIVAVISEDIQELDAKIHSMSKSWTDDDMVVFINAKRTVWSKCCSLAKANSTLVELPTKLSKTKACSLVRDRLKLKEEESWVSEMISSSCSLSAWSKDIDLEKLDMVLGSLELIFMKRRPRDKADLGCALGFQASEVLAKISESQHSGDAISFCKMIDIVENSMVNSMHAIQAISSSASTKNSKLSMLKSMSASNEKIMEFKKNDGSNLFHQYAVSKAESGAKISFSFADYISVCEASGVVPYGSWGSLAWTAILLHKSGEITSQQLAKIISAYRSARKVNKNVANA